MEAYMGFAAVYDNFMEEVDYPQWIQHLEDTLKRLRKQPKTIVDLGCGTGNVTIPLARKGYEVLGVDLSCDMLAEAQHKAAKENLSIPFFCQDMVELALPRKVDAIISLCDSLNYLIEDGELRVAFEHVAASLVEGGLFLFDMNTAYKFQEVLGNKTYAATTEEAAYFWENSYDPEDGINEYYVNFFFRQAGKETYERVEEYHYERAYTLDEVKAYLEECNMELLGVYDGYGNLPPTDQTQRYFFVAKLKEAV